MTTLTFRLKILSRYEVSYYECSGCGSLQTERPYWLDETYADPSMGLDVGRVQRVVMTSLVTTHILTRLGVARERPSIDWGGAEGLFTRLLRDRGFNFLSYDKYREPFYAREFSVDDPGLLSPAALTAFEVFEHLPEPLEELGSLFSLQPDVVTFTTETYDRQGPDWDYLAPQEGGHVFFYTPRALEWIAERFGYEVDWLGPVGVYCSERALAASSGTAKAGWDRLRRSKSSILEEAIRDYAEHLLGEPWKYVHSDYEKVVQAFSTTLPAACRSPKVL